MGVLPIVLLILAMKIPILGLMWLVWWAGRPAPDAGPSEQAADSSRPRLPEPPGSPRPRRRGPHGGGASVPPRRVRSATGLVGAQAAGRRKQLPPEE